jgi:hypothetical protein
MIIHLCIYSDVSSRSKRPCRLYLPGCIDMLHKPCAHSNKHNSLQRLQLRARVAQHAAGRLVPSPMCYFGLAYIAVQLAVWHVHKPCAAVARITCRTYTDQFELQAFAQHANERMPACSHVMTQSDMPCSLCLAVGMLHKPVQAVATQQQMQNKLLSICCQYVLDIRYLFDVNRRSD